MPGADKDPMWFKWRLIVNNLAQTELQFTHGRTNDISAGKTYST
jgi:hypothetical protein